MSLPCRLAPRDITSLLGTIQNAAFVAPLGNHLSIQRQQCLNYAVACAGRASSKQRWWFTQEIDVPPKVLEDIATIYQALNDNPTHPVWQSYIGFLVNRKPTSRIISNALYEGIGGWSPVDLFRWRLSRSDLIYAGFQMKHLKRNAWEPDINAPGTHINVLEFVAIIINLLLMIVLSCRCPAPIGGHLFAVFADNTSAVVASLRVLLASSKCASPCPLHLSIVVCFGFPGKSTGPTSRGSS
jgi:hypothetical protein